AAPDDAAELVKKRSHLMETNEDHFKPYINYMKGRIDFSPSLADEAKAVVANAKEIPSLFPPGSTTPKSRAKPEIWQNFDDFQTKAKGLETAAGKLAEISAKDDKDAIGAQLRVVGKACDNCHDSYRAPEKD
ncbi:MAG TPA: cytochrome c, partial [Candidatus Cybelea sp.]|nr:cytochrome c [Candidatus Cybelea sp.]